MPIPQSPGEVDRSRRPISAPGVVVQATADHVVTDAPVLLCAKGTIPTASVRTLNATPYEVIAAPGSGKYIEIVSCKWWLDYGTAAYDAAASGDTLGLKYTNGSGTQLVQTVAGNAIGAASADYHALVKAVAAAVLPVANAKVVAHIDAGEWYSAAGDSPLKYEILYFVRKNEAS